MILGSDDFNPEDWTCPDYLTLEDPAEGRRCWAWVQVVQALPNTKMDEIVKAAAMLEAYLKDGSSASAPLKVVKTSV